MDTATTTGGVAVSTGMASSTYADSVDSSPRSRGGEPWDETYTSSATASKLRLMCSYGGHIVPRPHDKSLCYLGGETRIVVVERHTTLSDLSSKLSRSLLAGRSFTLKYQLPSEDLDSLISVTTDEDLDNMIEEYDRIVAGASGKASRLRLFLFPVKVESPSPSSSSIGSLLDDSKSETWFVDALNGAIGMGVVLPGGLPGDSAASSVNCLLGLDDEYNLSVAAHPVAIANSAFSEQGGDLNNHQHLLHQHSNHHHVQLPRPDSCGKLKQGQDVHSLPDSPMLDTTSSFGSTSSAPSLSHLPPIRVRPDDQSPDKRGFSGGGLDEHFSQMNLQKQEEGFKDGRFGGVMHHQNFAVAVPIGAVVVNPSPSAMPAVTSVVATPVASASPTENPNHSGRAFSSDDDKSDHLGVRKPPQASLVQPHKTSNAIDFSTSERPVYHQERTNSPVAAWNTISDSKQEVQSSTSESNYRVQAQVSEQGHTLPVQTDHLQQLQQQQQKHHHQHQQQYIQASHFVQHHPSNPNSLLLPHPSAPMIPMQSSYYQMHHTIHPQQQLPQTHSYNSQIPMYFLPVQQNPAYAVPIQQPNLVDGSMVPSSTKPITPDPNQIPPPRGIAPQKSEFAAANVYRPSATTASVVPQSSSAPQLVRMGDQTRQFIGSYHPMQNHPSHSAAAPTYSYEFSSPIPSQQMFYNQAGSSPLPPHFQAISSGATMISDAQPQLLQQQQQPPPDVKQSRSAS